METKDFIVELKFNLKNFDFKKLTDSSVLNIVRERLKGKGIQISIKKNEKT